MITAREHYLKNLSKGSQGQNLKPFIQPFLPLSNAPNQVSLEEFCILITGHLFATPDITTTILLPILTQVETTVHSYRKLREKRQLKIRRED